jgi:hypothetical protein
MYAEQVDAFFIGERGRARRLTGRDPERAVTEQSDTVRFGKKVFASFCDTPLGLTMTFCPA